jgi:cold shock CspA family protein
MENGIIKQWNPAKNWGIIYATGERRYFLHNSKVVQGTPGLFRRVEFEIAPPRNPAELPQATKVIIGEEVTHSLRDTAVRP